VRTKGGIVTDGFPQNQENQPSTQSPQTPAPPAAAQPEPGWYPDRITPNLQKYWDGSAWIAQRRWIGGQWVSEPPPGVVPQAGVAAGGGAVPGYAPAGYAGRPYVATSGASPAARSLARPTLTGSSIGLFVCSVLVIVGSITPWITVSAVTLSVSANGTDSGISQLIGVNGWITFAGGLILLIVFCLMAIQPEPLYRTLALVVAVVVAGFAVYDLVRVVQKVSQASSVSSAVSPVARALQPDINVGWGLIVLALAALGAVVFAIVDTRNA
jgi:hypothetical protein